MDIRQSPRELRKEKREKRAAERQACEDVERYLSGRSIRNERSDGAITAYIKETDVLFDVLCRFRDSIEDFEVTKGSLNDVFLAVTGREIRE